MKPQRTCLPNEPPVPRTSMFDPDPGTVVARNGGRSAKCGYQGGNHREFLLPFREVLRFQIVVSMHPLCPRARTCFSCRVRRSNEKMPRRWRACSQTIAGGRPKRPH